MTMSRTQVGFLPSFSLPPLPAVPPHAQTLHDDHVQVLPPPPPTSGHSTMTMSRCQVGFLPSFSLPRHPTLSLPPPAS